MFPNAKRRSLLREVNIEASETAAIDTVAEANLPMKLFVHALEDCERKRVNAARAIFQRAEQRGHRKQYPETWLDITCLLQLAQGRNALTKQLLRTHTVRHERATACNAAAIIVLCAQRNI